LPVEFVIHASDLRRALKQLKANRGKFQETDFVDVLVSGCAVTFRSVGTEAEVPADGKRPGTVKIPLRIVDKMNSEAKTLKTEELTFLCEPGRIKVGSWSVRHPDIDLGELPDQRISLPIDVSVLDTLALAEILSVDQIVAENMRSRVEEARQIRARVVADAHAILEPLEISEQQLQGLVNAQVEEAAGRLRRSLGIV